MVDIVMLVALISGYLCTLSNIEVSLTFTKPLSIIIATISALIPHAYMLFLVLSQVLPKILECFIKTKSFMLKQMTEFGEANNENEALLHHSY